jgi:hypothetical protein
MILSLIGCFPHGTAGVDSQMNKHEGRRLRSRGRPAGGSVWSACMVIIFGLIILIAAVVAGVAGVLGNGGSGHALTHGFAVFGYHVTGSTGTLFLYGIVVGAVALAGLSLLLAGARRTSRRGSDARRGLQPASDLGNGTPRSDPHPGAGDSRQSGPRLFGYQFARQPAAAGPPESVNGQPAPDAPASEKQLANGSHP